jgi:transcription initiation factor TFIIH subunit 2
MMHSSKGFFFCREVLKEDASGSLQASVDDVVHRSKRRRLLERPVNVRLGMVRL